jgi:exodeoxyribonuclease VIII
MLITEADGRVHFSTLREMRKSPAHYKWACENKREQTRPMLLGSITDALVFGHRKVAPYAGDRRSKAAWGDFVNAHPGDICCTAPEIADAMPAVTSLRAHKEAWGYLHSEHAELQRVMLWEDHGLPCAAGVPGEGGRGGFDVLDQADEMITDLKSTNDASPAGLERHILAMCWHAQGAWYVDGAAVQGMPRYGFRLVCVESSAPHVVTCVRLSPELLNLGRRLLRTWIERLKQCAEANHWPGYVEREYEQGVPEWVDG